MACCFRPKTEDDGPWKQVDLDQDSATMTVNMAYPYKKAGAEGTHKREVFMKKLSEDLSKASKYPDSLFSIVAVAEAPKGTTTAEVEILPNKAKWGGSPQQVAEDIALQAKGDETRRAARNVPQSLLAKGAITHLVRNIEVHPPHVETPPAERELPPAEEATDGQHEAYCGLKVSREKPHAVDAIVDICDPNGRKPGQEGYCNEVIQNGDIILKVNGLAVDDVDSSTLHKYMQGPLNSVLSMELKRHLDGVLYVVNLRRHKFHDMDQEAIANLGTVYKDGTDAEKQVLLDAAEDDSQGFCGLGISALPPHEIVSVQDVCDGEGRSMSSPEFSNETIIPGDIITKIDGQNVRKAPQAEIKKLLQGPLNSTFEMSLLRMQGNAEYHYTVRLLRHKRHEFDTGLQAAGTEECFCGLRVTPECPHRIISADDCCDVNMNAQDSMAYINEVITPGDIILMVDGKYVQKTPTDELHELLQGPLNSIVELTLARKDSGKQYSVLLLRHLAHTIEKPDGEERERTIEAGKIKSSTVAGAATQILSNVFDGPSKNNRGGAFDNVLGNVFGSTPKKTATPRAERTAYCGIQLSDAAPYSVLSADDVREVDGDGRPSNIGKCVKPGDTLISVDGKPVDALASDAVQRLLEGRFLSTFAAQLCPRGSNSPYEVRLQRHLFFNKSAPTKDAEAVCGLKVSNTLPRVVEKTVECVDGEGHLEGTALYSNHPISPGDMLLAADGKAVQNLPISDLVKILKGPMHSVLELQLATKEHQTYVVHLMRHRLHEFDEQLLQGHTTPLSPQNPNAKQATPTGPSSGSEKSPVPPSVLRSSENGQVAQYGQPPLAGNQNAAAVKADLGYVAQGDANRLSASQSPSATNGSDLGAVNGGGAPANGTPSPSQNSYCGLKVTSKKPYTVVSAADVRDANDKRQDEAGYMNPMILPGDLLVMVDGKNSWNITFEELRGYCQNNPDWFSQWLLSGPVNSMLEVHLARNGQIYDVKLKRHSFYEFDGARNNLTQ